MMYFFELGCVNGSSGHRSWYSCSYLWGFILISWWNVVVSTKHLSILGLVAAYMLENDMQLHINFDGAPNTGFGSIITCYTLCTQAHMARTV